MYNNSDLAGKAAGRISNSQIARQAQRAGTAGRARHLLIGSAQQLEDVQQRLPGLQSQSYASSTLVSARSDPHGLAATLR